jgi:hypothetical protein
MDTIVTWASMVGRCRLKLVETSVQSASYQRLKPEYDEPLSKCAFNRIVRRYTLEAGASVRITVQYTSTTGGWFGLSFPDAGSYPPCMCDNESSLHHNEQCMPA